MTIISFVALEIVVQLETRRCLLGPVSPPERRNSSQRIIYTKELYSNTRVDARDYNVKCWLMKIN